MFKNINKICCRQIKNGNLKQKLYNFGPIANTSTLSKYIFSTDEKYEMIADMCRNFATKELKPIAAKMDLKSKFDMGIVKKLGKLGLMCATVPATYGGSDMDYISYVIAGEEISKGCASTTIMISVNNHGFCLAFLTKFVEKTLYLYPLIKFGTKEQIEIFGMPYMNGDKMGCFALTEPGNGSDAGAASTKATFDLDNKEWILNGEKAFITAASVSESCIVFATTDKDKKHKGISAFLVPLKSEGVTVGKPENKLGIRASPTSSINFDNVRVSEKNILGQKGDGFKIAMMTLDVGRISVASQAVGIAQAALEVSVQYTKERKSFNKNLCQLQTIQIKLADMETRINASRLLCFQCASIMDQNQNITKSAAMAKLYASETATYVTHQALQIHGGVGYMSEYPLERHYRDARITEIYEGTSEIQRLVIAAQLLKEYE
ncbi:hypothetical protein A3Q56_03981 [Intoshia linei]|uniref:Short-chain specific acyl-CoA dehydrogenase, mitochondrial n=1 Tax=Intoshia linei TaxID=1819745 RepID=A0A177B3T0_9BILA|nr:hypothetical protein A3Q56_03981 [Intoshia linei]